MPCFRSYLLSVFLIVLVSGCASTPPMTTMPILTKYGQSSASVHRTLQEHYQSWKGTPYAWGGRSKKGIDCSGFTQLTFQERLGLQIPRTTELQSKMGQSVDITELQVGDLVFFKTGKKVRHVGVYMGNNAFLHASTSKGVTISQLTNPYWQSAYWMARRVQ